ncbi:uncharacterized protein LOC62_04G005333 [Vanrija pseudolonga]|uniref:Uncharacterized protein n=1 Tax=Vanrija pseudolonga TaxID=143232 RepID=A0AAF0Y830_9TREE|nr:hypothetical protein LOC62_04G005333 [Vanrija pseudolonga]
MAVVASPPVTIDPTAFPTILDTIIAHSCASTLLALRATSKAFLERCNPRLVGHIILPHREHGAEWDGDGQCQDADVFPRPSPFPRLPMLLGYVRIMDQLSLVDHPEDLDGQLTGLETLRRMDGAWSAPQFNPSLTVVDFVNLVPEDPVWRDEINISIPTGPRRAVLHLRYDARDASQMGRFVALFDSGNVRDFVFVLWPINVHPSGGGEMRFLFGTIAQVLSDWRETEARSITLVGIGMCAGAPTDTESLWDAVEPFLTQTDRDAGGHRRHAVRFVAHQEWWDELGGRREIERVGPAWA